MKTAIRTLLTAAIIATTSCACAAEWTPGNTAWEQLPEIKRSRMGLYLTPQQAHDMKKADPKGVALFDIRTRAEAMFVGWPSTADALVPFLEQPDLSSEWDDKRNTYKLEPNQDFIPELERRLKAQGLDKQSTIILICRSGDRSAKAADRLQTAGYSRIYSVAEGFEGDMAKEGTKAGQRIVNGWKNNGLPWTYSLEKSRMYFPK